MNPPAGNPWRLAWRRFRRDRAAGAALAGLALIVAAIAAAPLLPPAALAVGPSLAAGRWSLGVALATAAASVAIGAGAGVAAGYAARQAGRWMLRGLDTLGALLLLAAVLLAVRSGGDPALSLAAIGAIPALGAARAVCHRTLGLLRREFVDAARLSGVPAGEIARRHVAPNLVGLVTVWAASAVPFVLLADSLASMVGFGPRAPGAGWGTLLGQGLAAAPLAPAAVLAPAVFLGGTAVCLIILAGSVRAALDVEIH